MCATCEEIMGAGTLVVTTTQGVDHAYHWYPIRKEDRKDNRIAKRALHRKPVDL